MFCYGHRHFVSISIIYLGTSSNVKLKLLVRKLNLCILCVITWSCFCIEGAAGSSPMKYIKKVGDCYGYDIQTGISGISVHACAKRCSNMDR